MKYLLETDGERLVYFLKTRLFGTTGELPLPNCMIHTGRQSEFSIFFGEVAFVHTACRMILAAKSLQRETNSRESRNLNDPVFISELKNHLRETYVPSYSLLDDLTRVVTRCVSASNEKITKKQRSRYKKHAMKNHTNCYMCGVALDFGETDKIRMFTMEHIWPQSFGGNSIEENLLPSCGSCNHNKKKNFPTWAMVNIQSMLTGFEPNGNDLKIDGSVQFALHHFAARRLAESKQISLKRAFLTLRPWTTPRIRDVNDVGDFFNLTNHQSESTYARL